MIQPQSPAYRLPRSNSGALCGEKRGSSLEDGLQTKPTRDSENKEPCSKGGQQEAYTCPTPSGPFLPPATLDIKGEQKVHRGLEEDLCMIQEISKVFQLPIRTGETIFSISTRLLERGKLARSG